MLLAAWMLLSCKPAAPEAPAPAGFTLVYSGRMEGEIEPCG